MKQQQHLYHQICPHYHSGANPEEKPDPDHPEGSDNENLEHLPPQEQAEEEEVAEEAEAKVPEAEDTEAEGGQQLPTGEEAGGRHLLLIGQLPCIAEANQPNCHERKRLAEGRIWCLLGNQVTITKAIIPWFGLLFLIIVTPTVTWKKWT